MNSMIDNKHTNDEREPGIEPKKFVLWLMLVSSTMLFAAFTSAVIVRRGDGNWTVFELPQMFLYSSIIIAISSLFMQWALSSAKKNKITELKISLSITFILGVIFILAQIEGWSQMVEQSVHFSFANPSGSFVYVITGVHLAHIVVGLGYLLVIFIKTLQHKIHKENLRGIAMCRTFWHFIGIVWIYLYVFLFLNR